MSPRDRIAFGGLTAAVLVATLALGGAPRWAQAIIALIVVGAMIAVLPSRRAFAHRAPLLLALLAATAWTALQLLPLPRGLLAALSPTLDGLRADGLSLAGVSSWSCASMDPPATLRALTYFATLSGVAFVALRLATSERGRHALVASVAGTCALVAVITGIHEVAGATALYGLYTPHQASHVIAPLLNSNHLGSLMAIGAACSLGLVLYSKQSPARRVMWAIAGMACVAVLLTTRSRGAMVGVGLGLATTLTSFVFYRFLSSDVTVRRKRDTFLTTGLPIGIVVTCVLVVAVWINANAAMHELEASSFDEIRSSTSKFAAWRSSFQLVEEAPWLGVGRGAFETTFTRVHPAAAFATFSHPENEAVQALVEWGVLGTALVAVLGAWTLMLAIKRWRDGPLAAGALGALAAVAFQSNFDFGLELLGVAIPAVVLAASTSYSALAETSRTQTRRLRAVRVAHAALLALGAVLLLTGTTRTVDEDHRALSEAPSREDAITSIAAHPLDYYAYAVLAEQLQSTGDPDTVAVFNHALRLHPTQPQLHWIAARMWLRAGRTSQAEAEYSTTVRFTAYPRAVILELAKVLPPERAAAAIPSDVPINALLPILGPQHPVMMLWLQRLLAQGPNLRAAELLYTSAMKSHDLATAEVASRHKCQAAPTPACRIELARTLTLRGKLDETVALLADVGAWIGPAADRRTAWLLLCDTYAASRHQSEATDCLRRLERSGLAGRTDEDVTKRWLEWRVSEKPPGPL